jgi:hypothetical protein
MGSVWTGLLLVSIVGLFHPFALVWVLVMQFIYQCVW